MGSMFGDHGQYLRGALDEADVDPDPLVQVRRWLEEVEAADAVEPYAMAVSTVDASGQVSSRNVLLRGIDHGFVFYSNRTSAKGRALAQEPRCSLLFSWLAQQRQVRVEGVAELVDDAMSDAYFADRPRGSQIAAWASTQSERLANRDELVAAVEAAQARFGDTDPIPRPPFWGGFRVVPQRIELWQGRLNRLHDRLVYERVDGGWEVGRLSP